MPFFLLPHISIHKLRLIYSNHKHYFSRFKKEKLIEKFSRFDKIHI
ncbi:hypothetical protein RC62_983 [Flavobacterium aquidurense]|uniref:Uncharacterized protein n=1 Tax=Flavobacterium aquidurense TaxID=362413 RepID=A0A0Q0W4K7_9FLAO|nr:hypothetical protein RC62_983 [Flavobacterium aquidurense]